MKRACALICLSLCLSAYAAEQELIEGIEAPTHADGHTDTIEDSRILAPSCDAPAFTTLDDVLGCTVCVPPSTTAQADIEAAIATAHETTGEAEGITPTVCLGAGSYSGFEPLAEGSGISLPTGTHVRGCGKGVTTVDAAGSRVFSVQEVGDVAVSGLTIANAGPRDGASKGDGVSAFGVAVWVFQAENVTLSELAVNAAHSDGGAVYLGASKGVVVDGVDFVGCSGRIAGVNVFRSAVTASHIHAVESAVSGSWGSCSGVFVLQVGVDPCPVTLTDLYIGDTVLIEGAREGHTTGGLFINNFHEELSPVTVSRAVIERVVGYSVRVEWSTGVRLDNVLVLSPANDIETVALYQCSGVEGAGVTVCGESIWKPRSVSCEGSENTALCASIVASDNCTYACLSSSATCVDSAWLAGARALRPVAEDGAGAAGAAGAAASAAAISDVPPQCFECREATREELGLSGDGSDDGVTEVSALTFFGIIAVGVAFLCCMTCT